MRFGVVGAGTIGLLRSQSIVRNPATELAAVMDVDPARARSACVEGAVAVTSVEDLLGHDLDVVVVSSPVHHHEAACVAAFEAGAHVLCEKPLSNSARSCRTILEAADRAGRSLSVGFNHRYYPSIRYMRETIEQGRIGRLDHLRVFGGHDGLSNFRADWQFRAPESGGGAMMDVGIHMTDLARHFLGEVSQVYGVSSERVWEVPGSEDNAIAVLRSPDGVPASYHATWNEWKGYRFYVEAYGELGMVRGYYAPMRNLLITQDRPGGPRRTSRKLYPEIMVREKLRSWTSTALLSFEDELSDLLRRLDGAGGGVLADGFAGMRAVEIAEAVRTSTREGRAIDLEPQPQSP